MDCTGSMGMYINSAKENIRAIVEEIIVSEKSDIRLALVEYRDHPPQVYFRDFFLFLFIYLVIFLGYYICYSCT